MRAGGARPDIWTDERVAKHHELWALKDERGKPLLSTREMADELSANGFAALEPVSRGAVIGRARRDKLESHKRVPTEASIRRRHRRENRYSLRESAGQLGAIRQKLKATELIEMPKEEKLPPNPKRIYQLASNRCRWPIDVKDAEGFPLFCNEKIADYPPYAYCLRHFVRSSK